MTLSISESEARGKAVCINLSLTALPRQARGANCSFRSLQICPYIRILTDVVPENLLIYHFGHSFTNRLCILVSLTSFQLSFFSFLLGRCTSYRYVKPNITFGFPFFFLLFSGYLPI